MSEIKSGANSVFQRGRKLQREGRLEEAIALFREAIKRNPSFSWNYYLLGEVLAKKNQLREAASCYKKALSLNPEKYQFYQAALDGLRKIPMEQKN
jgi:tetratricopeptide (TPR) repeat protein